MEDVSGLPSLVEENSPDFYVLFIDYWLSKRSLLAVNENMILQELSL